jgi:hypothetical protein
MTEAVPAFRNRVYDDSRIKCRERGVRYGNLLEDQNKKWENREKDILIPMVKYKKIKNLWEAVRKICAEREMRR